jgi:hypothetical protein
LPLLLVLLLLQLLLLLLLQPCLPEWTFQPSALQALWLQPLSGLEGDQAELDWSLLLPQYSPSLVPLVEGAHQVVLCGQACCWFMCQQDKY